MKLNCPECKNDVDLASNPEPKSDDVLECNHCGITLLVTGTEGGQVQTEITDEGK